IRRIWYAERWWFVIEDIVSVLTDSNDPKQYIQKLKQRDEILAEGWVQIVRTLLVQTEGGKQPMNCADTESIFRIIQSIPSKKAEPFKRWLAKVGYERVQEIENPELAQERMKKENATENVASKVMRVYPDSNIPNDNNYINFSVNNDSAEVAPVASMVMQRSEKSCLSRLPSSILGWSASALNFSLQQITEVYKDINENKEENEVRTILYTYFDRTRNSKFSLSNELIGCCSKYVRLTKEDFDVCPINKNENKVIGR
ncbi:MAG: Bro-N domain-containing protein, partial [Nanoarchaeota archaeon]